MYYYILVLVNSQEL